MQIDFLCHGVENKKRVPTGAMPAEPTDTNICTTSQGTCPILTEPYV
jgi:hypothetical protein